LQVKSRIAVQLTEDSASSVSTRLYDSTGTLYAYSNGSLNTSTTQVIQGTALESGTYYIAVKYDSSYGSYTVTYDTVSLDTTLTEFLDAPGTIATPYSIAVGETFKGNMNSSDNDSSTGDWIAIDLVAGQDYRIQLTEGTISSATVKLYDSQGNLFINATGSTNSTAFIDTTITNSGIYYIAANSSSSYGSYTISVTNTSSTLIGTNGNDLFLATSVLQKMMGNEGNDTVSFIHSDSRVLINLATNQCSGGYAEGDELSSIENLIGSTYNDQLIGDATDNLLKGGAGNDTIDGGTGDDTAVFSGNFADYTMSFDGTSHTITDTRANHDGTDVVRGVEHFQFADGTLEDILPPALDSFAPADATMSVPVSSNVVLTFTEPVKPSTGNIVITNGSDTRTIDVTDTTQVTFNGNTVIIAPTDDLQAGTSYHIAIENDAMTDEAGNPFAGTSDYTFTTESASLPRHTLSGSITFWKDTLPLSHVELQTTSVIPTMPEVEFKNLQLHTDGTRTVELWVNSPSSTVQSVQVELELQAGSSATWQTAATMPSSWTTLTSSNSNSHFAIGSIGVTPLATTSTQLGSLTLSAPTDASRFELAMLAGTINGDMLTPYSATSSGVTTGGEGHYNFNELMKSTYTLQANKESTGLSNAVTAADALAALKMAVALNPNDTGAAVSPYQFLAADINHDGKIRATDALNILKMAVGLSSAPEEEWIFVPETVGSQTMNRNTVDWSNADIAVTLDHDIELDLIGIVKGDVDGSWVG